MLIEILPVLQLNECQKGNKGVLWSSVESELTVIHSKNSVSLIHGVMASFVSTWHSWGYHRERSFSWGNASMRSNSKAFFSISDQGGKAPCRWDHLWAGSLGFYKRAGWASQGRQASKEHPSKASASAPASWPAWVPVLTSFGDEQQYGSVSQINPFLPNLLLGHDVCAGIETLTKTIFNKTRPLLVSLPLQLKYSASQKTYPTTSTCLSQPRFISPTAFSSPCVLYFYTL
jgi:hypothetical protein